MSPGGILVELPNWIGDCVLAVPALRALARGRPEARIILAGRRTVTPLFGRWPCGAVLGFDRGGIGSLLGRIRMLRAANCRDAVILGPSFRAALPGYLAGVPRRIGHARDARGLLLTECVDRPGRDRHLAWQYLDLVGRIGADAVEKLDASLPLGEDEIDGAIRMLQSRGLAPSRSLAFCPGAVYGITKRWPEEHWIDLGKSLGEEGWTILLIGGAAEREAAARLATEIGSHAHPLAGLLTLRESLAVFRVIAGAVSNDSGAMHMAAAAGGAVLGLFGSTSPIWTGPVSGRARSLSLGLSCAPCFAKSCPTRIECLRDLDPERVLCAVRDLVAAPAGGSP